MERQKPTTQIRHNDDFSKALIEATASYFGGSKVVSEEQIPSLQKKGGEDDFTRKDPKEKANAADPAVALNPDLKTGRGVKQSHGATIKYTNVVTKEAREPKEIEDEKEETKDSKKAEKESMKETFNLFVDGVFYIFEKKNKEGKEQGVDGKACWKGYRYAGTENGKDKCVKEEIGTVELDEKAPPGAKYERMVKHIKKGYSEGGVTKKEKGIAYATAWKQKNKEMKEALDPVGKEDKDIDNDGDHDKSDKYLAARRKKVGKIIDAHKKMKESIELEQEILDEKK